LKYTEYDPSHAASILTESGISPSVFSNRIPFGHWIVDEH